MMGSITPPPLAAWHLWSRVCARGALLTAIAASLSHCSLGDFDSLSAGLGGDRLNNGELPAGAAGFGPSEPDSSATQNTAGAGGEGGSSGLAGAGGSTEAEPDAGPGADPDAGNPGPENLLADPGFELGTPRWTPVGTCTLALSTVNPHGGNNCLLTSDRSESWEAPGYDLVGKLEESTTYAAAVWVRMSAGSSGMNLTFKNRCVDVAGEATYTTMPSILATTDWALLSGTFTTPPCVLIDSVLYVEGPAVGEEYFIDDVSLYRTSP